MLTCISTPFPLGAELATTEPLTGPLFGITAMYCTPGGLLVETGAEVCANDVGSRAANPRTKEVECLVRMLKKVLLLSDLIAS